MAVIPDDVATELGRPTPLDLATTEQFASWIERAVRLIQMRAARMQVEFTSLDQDVVDDVVVQAVAAHARNPEGVEYYDVSVDDAREMRRWSGGSAGRIFITDEWWSWLFPDADSGAFSVRPSFEPDHIPGPVPWLPSRL